MRWSRAVAAEVVTESMAQDSGSHRSRSMKARWPTRYKVSASDRTPAVCSAAYSPRLWPMTIAGSTPADRQKAVRAISKVTTASCVCAASLVDMLMLLSVIRSRNGGNPLSLQIATHRSTVSRNMGFVRYNSAPMPA